MASLRELQEVLLAIETGGWEAQHQGQGRSYYGTLLAKDAVMVLPGVGLVNYEAALDAMDRPPWSWYKLRNPKVHLLNEGAAVLTYRVLARRDFAVEHQAIVGSTYVLVADEWKLALRQETVV